MSRLHGNHYLNRTIKQHKRISEKDSEYNKNTEGGRNVKKEVPSVPIWEKMNLTIAEAAAYSNIGENKIRELISDARCTFVLHLGNRTLIKRKEFEKYIGRTLEI